jgi:hypothetical protein
MVSGTPDVGLVKLACDENPRRPAVDLRRIDVGVDVVDESEEFVSADDPSSSIITIDDDDDNMPCCCCCNR